MGKITIGILNKDGLEYLEKTIPAVLSLDYEDKEILVLDNGSSDGSVDFLNSFEDVKVLKNKENEGYGKGKNKIVSNATGEYVLLLDNDILLEDKDILNKLLSFYISKKKISFLSFPLEDLGSKNTLHYGLYFNTTKKPRNLKELEKVEEFCPGGFIGGAVFFKRSIYKELGGFDEIYPFNIDDYDLSARSWISNYKIYIYTKISAIHLGVSNRAELNSWCWKNKYSLCGFNRMILKNYTFKNVLFWLPISSFWIFVKTLKFSFKFKSFKPVFSYFVSLGYFFRDLGDTLKVRKIIQKDRILKEDVFLKIKMPEFYKSVY